MVATCKIIDVERKVLFPYGTPPAMIKAGLDTEAQSWEMETEEEDEPVNWPAGEEIDIDDFMTGRWVRS